MAIKKTATSKTSPIKVSKPSKFGSSSGGQKKSAADSIIELVAQAYAVGQSSLSRDRVAMGSGMSKKTITNTLPKLQKKGLLTYTAEAVSLTEAGIEAAGDAARRPSSNAEHHQRLVEGLKKREAEMFEFLADGKTWNKDDLAEAMGFQGSQQKTFVNCIGGLSGKKLVEYPSKGQVRLTDGCFVLERGQP